MISYAVKEISAFHIEFLSFATYYLAITHISSIYALMPLMAYWWFSWCQWYFTKIAYFPCVLIHVSCRKDISFWYHFIFAAKDIFISMAGFKRMLLFILLYCRFKILFSFSRIVSRFLSFRNFSYAHKCLYSRLQIRAFKMIRFHTSHYTYFLITGYALIYSRVLLCTIYYQKALIKIFSAASPIYISASARYREEELILLRISTLSILSSALSQSMPFHLIYESLQHIVRF